MEPTDQEGRDPWEIFGWHSRVGPRWGLGKTQPLDSSNSWIHPHRLLSPARAFKWSGRLAEVCSAHPVGHCSAATHQRLGPWTGVSSLRAPAPCGRPAHELRYSIYREPCGNGLLPQCRWQVRGDFLVYPGEFVSGPLVTFFFTIPPSSTFPPFWSLFHQLLRNRKHLGTQALFEVV